MPSGNNATVDGQRDFENELLRMVEGLENHPSVVVWVHGGGGWTDLRTGDLIDMHSYPGPEAPVAEAHRAAVLGEFGGLEMAVAGHNWSTHHWGYLMLPDKQDLAARYARVIKQVWELHNLRGLSAAAYTQTADVETECNGLDRKSRRL